MKRVWVCVLGRWVPLPHAPAPVPARSPARTPRHLPPLRTRHPHYLPPSPSSPFPSFLHPMQVYRPVVSAVNEAQGVVFSAVYWVLQNTQPLFGAQEPSGR